MASIMRPVRIYAPLYLMQPVPRFMYVIAAASLLAVVAYDMDKGLKGRVTYRTIKELIFWQFL